MAVILSACLCMGGYVVVATYLNVVAYVFAVCATDKFWNTNMSDVM
jgi:hypothetical protein